MDGELRPEDLERIEDALRAELAAGAAAPAFRPAPAALAPADPLDDFFWREDEAAQLAEALAPAAAPQLAPVDERRREWLGFFLGGEEYAVDVGQVREILKPPEITEVPRAPREVLGVIMVHGEVVTVFDPRRRLGLPPAQPGRQARVLVCDAGGEACGLLVDAVSQVVRLPDSAVEPRPGGIGRGSDGVAALGRAGDRLLILLDLAAVLGAAPEAR